MQKQQVTETSPITLTNSLLHREQCQPVQPVVPSQDSLNPDDFEAFKVICDRWGYTFEPFQVTTEDGWILTVFRLTGYTGLPARTYVDGTIPIFF